MKEKKQACPNNRGIIYQKFQTESCSTNNDKQERVLKNNREDETKKVSISLILYVCIYEIHFQGRDVKISTKHKDANMQKGRKRVSGSKIQFTISKERYMKNSV